MMFHPGTRLDRLTQQTAWAGDGAVPVAEAQQYLGTLASQQLLINSLSYTHHPINLFSPYVNSQFLLFVNKNSKYTFLKLI